MKPGVVLASLALHGLIALGLLFVPKRPPPRGPVVVTIRQPSRPKAPGPLPEPPPPAPAPAPPPKAPPRIARATPSHAPRAAAPPPPAAAPAPASTAPAAPADYGLSMSGTSGGGDGPSVPGGGGGGEPGGAAPAPKPAAPEGCAEPLVKAKAIEVPQPSYPDAARESGAEGKVRIEITLDASGAVAQARVIASLGAALDEAALAAARSARFEPATRCGKAVGSTFVLSFRFEL